MLQELRIKNFAIIDELELIFLKGVQHPHGGDRSGQVDHSQCRPPPFGGQGDGGVDSEFGGRGQRGGPLRHFRESRGSRGEFRERANDSQVRRKGIPFWSGG